MTCACCQNPLWVKLRHRRLAIECPVSPRSGPDQAEPDIPGGAYYDVTGIDTSKGERWFCSEAEP